MSFAVSSFYSWKTVVQFILSSVIVVFDEIFVPSASKYNSENKRMVIKPNVSVLFIRLTVIHDYENVLLLTKLTQPVK